jgi:hypothetical protein
MEWIDISSQYMHSSILELEKSPLCINRFLINLFLAAESELRMEQVEINSYCMRFPKAPIEENPLCILQFVKNMLNLTGMIEDDRESINAHSVGARFGA